MVRDSEEEPQPRGFTARIAAWWSRWRKSRGDKKADLEAHLIDTDITSPHQGAPGGDVPASSAPGGDTLASVMDRMSAMHGCALFGSLSLIPYVGGPAGLLKDFTNGYRQGFCRVFSSCWGLVGLGVSCSFARSRYQRLYARLSSRFGMLDPLLYIVDALFYTSRSPSCVMQ
ncbi:hypothetical protein EJB05_18095 [Eragrostis curvula]|uniref:Uncharacterized protein n=1 Tax=Eragrostis curvula TaxID=38414 RepID=A0A5J9VKX1_9POAL|nr:hypothetical protein EJB05_18095 [Eragrostis curvula]